ncbi:MAG: glycosyltransferase [Bacteroidia bacterium]
MSLQLLEEGHSVTLFTFRYQYPSFLFPGKTQYSNDPAPASPEIKVRIHSLSPLNWYKTAEEIASLQPDHVILRFWIPFMAPCLGTIGRRIRKLCKTRITGLMDNVIPHEKRPGDKLLIRYFCSTCDDFMTLSHQVTEDLKEFSDKPCRYSPHPIYDQYGTPAGKTESAMKLGLSPDKNYLLFFGLVRKYKGLDLLLEGFAQSGISKSHTLLIAGEFYDKPEYYESIIRKHQLQDHVIIHNRFIPDRDVRYYFGLSDLVTQTYRTATQSGISQMAFHFEKPMLVTNVGGLGEIIQDERSGLVADPTPESIAEKLNYFSSMTDKTAFLPEIRKEKANYSWPVFTRILLS